MIDQLNDAASLLTPLTPLDYVAAWFRSQKVSINARRDVHLGSRRMKFSDLLVQIAYDYSESVREARKFKQAEENEFAAKQQRQPKVIGFAGFPIKDIENGVHIHLRNMSEEAFLKIKANLEFKQSSQASGELERFVKALIKEPTDLDFAVFKHILWQVKRLIWERPRTWELMATFVGPQGTGKTTAIRKLAAPINELFLERNLKDIITDERSRYILQNTYLMLFEELEKASKVDIESLKSLMSKDKINWRILGRNADDTGYQNCTFIGTSNKSITEVFYDPTGMRRFYEFVTNPVLDQGAINSINYFMIWQSVDENAACPIEHVKEKLFSYQEEHLRQRTTIEYWVEESGVEPDQFSYASKANRIDSFKLYTEYKDFCHERGFNSPFSEPQFRKQIISLGFERKRYDNGNTYFCVKRKPKEQIASVINFPKAITDE